MLIEHTMEHTKQFKDSCDPLDWPQEHEESVRGGAASGVGETLHEKGIDLKSHTKQWAAVSRLAR